MNLRVNRFKLLLKNFLVYGFGGIISKLIPLIMVPIITRLMPNSFYYGISDLSNTIISLFSAIAVMGMYDAMYRLFFEKDDADYKKEVCSTTFVFTIIASIVVALIMVALNQPISQLFYNDVQYGNLVMLCAMSVLIGATNSIICAPTRMQNKWVTYLVANTLSPLISYSISIPLLLNGFYLIALPLSSLISATVIEVYFVIANRKRFSFRKFNKTLLPDLLKIALPLLPNFIIYWIFNSSDRVMISNLIGVDQSGIYAVGAKFGQISQLIYLAFAGGYQYFAFSIMKDKDNTEVVSKVFSVLAAISFACTLFMICISDFLIRLLFEEEYWSSYITIPYLFLSPLLLMLFQIGTNQFLVIKKTWPNLIILGLGAIINIILNFVLIPVLGIEGASIATLIGYMVSIILCVIVLWKLKLIIIDKKTIISFTLFAAIFAITRIFAFNLWYVNVPLFLLYLLIEFLLYRKEIVKVLSIFKKGEKTEHE